MFLSFHLISHHFISMAVGFILDFGWSTSCKPMSLRNFLFYDFFWCECRHRWTGRYEAHLWDNSCRREGQSRKGRQGEILLKIFYIYAFNKSPFLSSVVANLFLYHFWGGCSCYSLAVYLGKQLSTFFGQLLIIFPSKYLLDYFIEHNFSRIIIYFGLSRRVW